MPFGLGAMRFVAIDSYHDIYQWRDRVNAPPPPPAIGASGPSPLYDWPRFLRWLRQRQPERVPTSLIVRSRVIARLNARLGA
jgi:hypothetical protein